MADKNIKVCYGVDVDCVSGWIGSLRAADSPGDISRGGVYSSSCNPESPRALQEIRYQSYLVYSRPYHRNFPQGM